MQSAPSAKAPQRVVYLDLLRAVAAFGIVFLHLSPLPAGAEAVTGLPWQIMTVYKTLFRWCVPAFLMISGALFLPPDRPFSTKKLWQKSIPRVLVTFFVWSAFYALAHCVIMGKGKWTFVNQLLRGHYHMWFLLTIVSLYILTPLLRKVTAAKEATRYFLAVGFVFAFLIPRLSSALRMLPLPHGDVFASLQAFLSQVNPMPGAYLLFYYVLGFALHSVSLRRGAWKLLAPAAVLSFAFAAFMTLRTSAAQGAPNVHFSDTPSLPVLVMSACLFLLARQACAAHPPSERTARILGRLSRWSLGVYLVHPFLLERLQVALPASPLALILLAPLEALVFYALSLAVSALVGLIPVVGKWIV